MDDILFLVYANSSEEALPTLTEEDNGVYKSLSDRALTKKHFSIHRESQATIPEVIEYLMKFKEQICLFHYSGHAGKDNLLLGDQEAHSGGIAKLLGQCPNLKLVVLNGCSTKEQVTALLNEEGEYGVPVVIATSRPIQDNLATAFAITFYSAMGEQFDSIGGAFESAMGAVNTYKERAYDTAKNRGIGFRSAKSDDPLWGIYVRGEKEEALNWSLPKDQADSSKRVSNIVPNKHLFDILFETLAKEKTAIAKLRDSEDATGEEIAENKKREHVLKNFPHPISEQLRKLIVPGDSTSGMVFYDKVGEHRLHQLLWSFKATMEFLAFTLLAQLWDMVKAKPEEWKFTEEQKKIIRSVFADNNKTDESYPYEHVIKLVSELVNGKESELFVKELAHLVDYEKKDAFREACIQLANIRKQVDKRMDKEQAEHLCLAAEEHLAEMFRHMGFISRYKLMSVKNIVVRKQRQLDQPQFIHQVIQLEQNLAGHSEEHDILDQYMENGSVILTRCAKDECCEPSFEVKSGEKLEFLNLTPFIFDENAYNKKAPLAKIHFFYRYDKDGDSLVFKHIYKSKDDPFSITDERNFKVIKAQFETFTNLLFNQSLNDAS